MEREIEEESMTVNTSGILNDMDFFNENLANSTESDFGFRFEYVNDSIICDRVGFSFSNIPLEVGNYTPVQYSGDPEEGVFASGGISCGDLAFASYNLEADFMPTLEVTDVRDEFVQGIFSISFVLDPEFESQYPEAFFFESVSFYIER